MPVQILCQPLLKQVLLYQQKLEVQDDENIGLQLNAIDFEFLRVVATHDRDLIERMQRRTVWLERGRLVDPGEKK